MTGIAPDAAWKDEIAPMFGIRNHARDLPPLSVFPLTTYSVDFALDRLSVGVDNIRHDVLLSPTVVGSTRKIVAELLSQYAGAASGPSDKQRRINLVKEIDAHKQFYRQVMTDALNKAKARREVQVAHLAQAAMLKMLVSEIHSQYELLIGHIKKTIREFNLDPHEAESAHRLQGKLQEVLQAREDLQRRVGLEMTAYWAEVEKKDILAMHEAVFGKRTPLFDDLLVNPLLHTFQIDNEFFMLAEYDLALGRRIEDPDKYETLLFFIRRLLNYLDLIDPQVKRFSVEQRLELPGIMDKEEEPEGGRQAYFRKIEGWLLSSGTMNNLLDWQSGKAVFKEMKKNRVDPEDLDQQKIYFQRQKKLLHFFYQQFARNGLVDRIAASYEMQPEYLSYCPPLTPHQIVQFLVLPKSRKIIKSRLKKMKTAYGRPFPMAPLNKKIKAMEQITTTKYKNHLLRFLNAFARYHRDRRNCELAREAMERVNIADVEKIINLSRENNTLFEFLLPHEQAEEKAAIIHHAVIKADVRGSTDLTYLLNERGLNPASYFSLNFFDPISDLLGEYDAVKVFIEGDAVILSIFEREKTPADWYCVARACGIALNMLVIIQRYNEKNQRVSLPTMELGVGISYLKTPPAFLFDGGNRIMISPAINQADRLSSCSKASRRLFARAKKPFNVYVFQTMSDEDMSATADDLFARYNVNGIELSPEAFLKLSNEIDLKMLQSGVTDSKEERHNFYTGKFPTKSGRYQRLVIREAQIPVVDPQTFKVKKISSRKYYEVCTNPKLYKLAKLKSQSDL